MPIPSYQTFMHPLIALIEDGEPHTLSSLKPRICLQLNISEAEQAQAIASNNKRTVVANRLGWARTYLHKAGLLSIPVNGSVQITERGRAALLQCPRINNAYLKQFPEFVEFIRPPKDKDDSQAPNTLSSQADSLDYDESTPEELLDKAAGELKRTLSSDLLDQVKQASPSFFEQLVVDLMLAMGYGGSRKEAGQATQYTSDGGIDGIINEDPLGLDTIYLQAKRYADKTVGRPEVQAFAGALDMQRAKKGVFITTSKFSADAVEFVSLIEKRIVLIDGENLTNLMIDHNLGVATKRVVAIKSIDSDYFNED